MTRKVNLGTIAQQLLYLDGNQPYTGRQPNGKERRAQAAKDRRQRKRERKWGDKV